jgi:hypothetical protein
MNGNVQVLGVEVEGPSRKLGGERLSELNRGDLSQNAQQWREGTQRVHLQYIDRALSGRRGYQPIVKISGPEVFLSKRIARTKMEKTEGKAVQ